MQMFLKHQRQISRKSAVSRTRHAYFRHLYWHRLMSSNSRSRRVHGRTWIKRHNILFSIIVRWTCADFYDKGIQHQTDNCWQMKQMSDCLLSAVCWRLPSSLHHTLIHAWNNKICNQSINQSIVYYARRRQNKNIRLMAILCCYFLLNPTK